MKKSKDIAIKCYNNPGDPYPGSYGINSPYYEGGLSEELLVWKDKLEESSEVKVLEHNFKDTHLPLIGNIKVTFNKVVLNIGILTVNNFNYNQRYIFNICFLKRGELYLQAPGSAQDHKTIYLNQ